MAEYLFRAYFKNRKNIIMNVSSAGFLNQRGKHVPEEISALMKNAGIDISGHQSSPLTPERIKASDLIIVMEMRQRDELMSEYPECASRIFLLSQLSASNQEERDIADPIGQTFSFYQYCFNDIKALVEELARNILKLT
jgi:protein-tyrosine-phosphatase